MLTWRRIRGLPRWGKILCVLLAAGVVTAGVPLVWYAARHLDDCHTGVEKIDGECIGIAGDGYDFGTKEIHDVAAAIAKENDSIEKEDGPYVTVALMMPLQITGNGELGKEMRSDLEGAYLGQRRANEAKGELPRIRLVLANAGQEYRHQDRIVQSLVRMTRSSKGPLRAVTGFNLSLAATKAAITSLTENNIPVLASRISADGIANDNVVVGRKFPGLARIIPTNQEAADALTYSLEGDESLAAHEAVVVADARRDSYSQSLADAFDKLAGRHGIQPMPFTSDASDTEGSTGDEFNTMIPNICASGADTVYFAGRAVHLRVFALKLAQIGCAHRHVAIISGSDAASLKALMSEKDWDQLREGEAKVTVKYVAPAHPQAWTTEQERWRRQHPGQEPPGYLTEPEKALKDLEKEIGDEEPRLGHRPSLDDSRTMLVYDGLLTIGTALHQAPTDNAGVPDLKDVGRQWSLLRTDHRVKGTSGWICLDNGGNAYDKPAAIVQLDPGPPGTSGTLKFLSLAWPLGTPQQPGCVIRKTPS